MENKYHIDYAKIVPDYLNSIMSESERDNITALAKIEREALLSKHGYDLSFSNAYVKVRATEIAYNSSRYSELNESEKAVLASNIALDKNAIINAIKRIDSPFFGLSYLKYYITNLRYFKFNRKPIKYMSEVEKTVYQNLTKYTKILINSITTYVGPVEPYLLINLLNEIISFDSELLDFDKKDTNTR